MKEIVKNSPDGKISYGIIRGTVKPIGQPIQSVMSPSVTGVLQVIKLRFNCTNKIFRQFHNKLSCSEHRIARGFAGFWTEQRKLIHVSSNEVPFTIDNGNVGVEIIDGLGSEILGSLTFNRVTVPQSSGMYEFMNDRTKGVRRFIHVREQIQSP